MYHPCTTLDVHGMNAVAGLGTPQISKSRDKRKEDWDEIQYCRLFFNYQQSLVQLKP